jgi:hypothetical protein
MPPQQRKKVASKPTEPVVVKVTLKSKRIALQKAAEERNRALLSQGLPTPWMEAKAARHARRHP